jgi:hypothetical protein
VDAHTHASGVLNYSVIVPTLELFVVRSHLAALVTHQHVVLERLCVCTFFGNVVTLRLFLCTLGCTLVGLDCVEQGFTSGDNNWVGRKSRV